MQNPLKTTKGKTSEGSKKKRKRPTLDSDVKKMTKDSLSFGDVVAAARPGLDIKKYDMVMEFAPQMNACCEKVKTICLIGGNVIFIIYRPGARGIGEILPSVMIFPSGLYIIPKIKSLQVEN